MTRATRAMIMALATLPAGSSAGCVPEDGRDDLVEDRADGDTLFVSPSGGSNDACTSSDPCSIEEAIDRAMAGDHIVFKNGTYDLKALGMQRIQTKRAGVTFRAQNTRKAKIVSTNAGSPIMHINKSDTSVVGLHFDCKDKARGIVLHNGTYGDILLQDNVVLGAYQAGIKIGQNDSRIDGVVVKGNYVEKVGTGHNAEAIYVGSFKATASSYIKNLEVMGNEFVLTPENGIECKGGPSTTNLSFHHNIFHTFHKQPWSDRNQTGVISCAAKNVDIYRNYFHDGTVESALLRVSPHSNMRIFDNVFENISGSNTFIKSKEPEGGSSNKTIVEDNWFQNVSAKSVAKHSGWVVRDNYGLDLALDGGDYKAYKDDLLAEIEEVRGGGSGSGGGDVLTDGSTPVQASGQGSGDVDPSKTLDGSLDTRWSSEGAGEWIRYDLGSTQGIGGIDIAWYKGDQRVARFRVQVAGAKSGPWTTVFDGESSGKTLKLESYDLDGPSGRFVRIVGDGNTSNDWNSITEVAIRE